MSYIRFYRASQALSNGIRLNLNSENISTKKFTKNHRSTLEIFRHLLRICLRESEVGHLNRLRIDL
jgi:hypothetical protein